MTGLKIFNTLSGKKEDFQTITPGKVLMYACGPTVYDLSHLGHARMALTFDVIQRYLRFVGYDVTFVRNITDIDDKIINRAKEIGVLPEQLSRRFTYTFWKDMDDLNSSSPDIEPRATEYIQQMIQFAEELVKKGFAYESGGDVYFDVQSFKQYGELKKQSLDDLLSGAREQVRSQNELKDLKKNPVDFALWKSTAKTETGWQSPWGWGRPGWHLECSSMIKNVLGVSIDIHGGGEDLVFPHHENEKAQSEALHGKPLARYWIHNSFVQVESEKMSKSLGNFQTIQNVLANYSADAIRLFVLQTHYRSPIEFNTESMEAARAGTARLLRAARHAKTEEGHDSNGTSNGKFQKYLTADHKCMQALRDDAKAGEAIKKLHDDFTEAMNNDFNTPQAISALFQMADLVFTTKDEQIASMYAAAIKAYAAVLGLRLSDTAKIIDTETGAQLVERMLDLRDQARANKDYKQSDLIRDTLANLGIKVMDVKGARAVWEKE
ncbi:MAG: cysteine--tRNA ligase [Candidatus Obscuribacterales bacterium]|nr:cysteine--tRNA ligase [Candidatus Obscuribacterales bacterium]